MNNIKKIVCDDREFSHGKSQEDLKKKILEHFGTEKVEIRRLDVGDFILVLDNGKRIAIERKTDLDWISSCNHRRVQNQAIKMAEFYDYRFIIIIGSYKSIQEARKYNIKFSKKQWISNAISLIIRYKCGLLMVENNTDFIKSLDSIARMTDRELEPLEKPKIIQNSGNVLVDVISVIPGIGKKKAGAILAHFGSLRAVMDASEKEIMKVRGIGKKQASEIKRWLN